MSACPKYLYIYIQLWCLNHDRPLYSVHISVNYGLNPTKIPTELRQDASRLDKLTIGRTGHHTLVQKSHLLMKCTDLENWKETIDIYSDINDIIARYKNSSILDSFILWATQRTLIVLFVTVNLFCFVCIASFRSIKSVPTKALFALFF